MRDNTSARVKGAPTPQFFARSLPLLGVLVGLGFVALLFLAGQFGERLPPVDDVHFAIADSAPCGTSAAGLRDLPRGEVFIPIGMTPIHVLLTLPEALPGDDLVVVLDSGVDRARFVPCAAGGVAQAAGDQLPFSARAIKAEDIAFALPGAVPGATYHLKIVQEAAISQKLFVMERGTFEARAEQQLRIRLMAYGAVTMMILYNLSLAYFAGNAAFAFNAAVSLSMLLLDTYLSGFGPAYLWPEQPWLAQPVLAFGLAGPSLFGPFYLAHFLGEDEEYQMRRIDYAWPVSAAFFLCIALFVVEVPALLALTATWIIMTFYYAGRIVLLARQGSARAAVLLFPLFGAVMPAMAAGTLDSWLQPDFGVLQDHLTEMALILEALCFTLALAFLLRLSRWREAQALRALNAQAQEAKQTLLRTLDQDRTRMASEIHDTAGQGLLFAISRLKQIEDPGAQVRDVSEIVTRTLHDLRNLSHDLHPSTLEHLGLSAALQAMADHAATLTAQEVTSDIDIADISLSPAQSLHIYRIVQELLTNALTHSQGNHVSVIVRAEAGEIRLQVADNGAHRGAPPASGGIGTTIVRERINALKGRFWSEWTEQGMKAEAAIPVLRGMDTDQTP